MKTIILSTKCGMVSLYVKKERKGSGLLQNQATYEAGIYKKLCNI
jgi:hypothetical protein